MPDKLTGALEDNILCALVWHPTLAHAVMMRAKPDLFSTKDYQNIAKLAFAHIEKFGAPPGVHIYDMLEDTLNRSTAEAKLVKYALNQMEKLRHDLSADFVISELDRFIELRRLSIAVDAASQALQGGKLEEAKKVLYDQPIIQPTSPGIWLDQPEQSLAFLNKQQYDYIPTGVKVLDNMRIMNARRRLLLFIGPKGVGKSWFLIHLGKHANIHGFNVLHITLELDEDVTSQRYVQAFFAMTSDVAETVRIARFKKDLQGNLLSNGIDYTEVLRQAATEENRSELTRRIKNLRHRPQLLIKGFPSASLTIGELNAYLDWLEKAQHFKPDLMLVDYVNEMAIDPRFMRQDLNRTIRRLRGIGHQRNMAVATATQGTRQSADAPLVTSTMVGEDWSMVLAGDVVLTISRTGYEIQNNLARILVAHAREKADHFVIMISQNYSIGQFCSDSVYMNETAQAQLNRLTGQGDDDEDD